MHRTYENEDITVFWDSDKCRHAKKCVTGAPEVFEFGRRPWIDISRGENSHIWKTIEKCPSGALGITYNHGIEVILDCDGHRSVALDGNKEIGECDYEESDGNCRIYHTHVLPEYGGKNIAKRLVYKVFEHAERNGLNIIPTCSYAAKVYGDRADRL